MTAQAHKLWHFNGGVHPEQHKDVSTREPIEFMRLPRLVVLPLSQHIGEHCEPLVKAGDNVNKGQVIARAPGYVSAAVHASTSGRVVTVEERPVPHPSGMSAPCIVIEPDGREYWGESRLPPIEDYLNADPVTLRNRVREAGIVGLGGAAFPSAVKLNPRTEQPIDTVILNGAECEPYITCDDMLMRERAAQVLDGLRIIMHVVKAGEAVIGIEDNKPEAYQDFCAALGGSDVDGIRVVQVPTLYPTGGEKQLIKVLTGREVPSQGLPIDVGMVCHNVGTAYAIYRAVAEGEPLISRIVTVTGGGTQNPRNFEVLLGTPVGDLIDAAGGYTPEAHRLVMGGPMMGFALSDDEVPVIKGTNCLLAATREETPATPPALPCIRCGACMRACPANLLPQQLYWFARARDFDKVQDYNLFDCIECGCCAYVCPSHIPLVQYYRFAKTEIWAQEEERRKADRARLRHEARIERLERLDRERKARLRKRKEELAEGPAGGADQDAKKAAIAAAMQRVAQKKSASAAADSDARSEHGT
jgi:electron transport complex protein RnfC